MVFFPPVEVVFVAAKTQDHFLVTRYANSVLKLAGTGAARPTRHPFRESVVVARYPHIRGTDRVDDLHCVFPHTSGAKFREAGSENGTGWRAAPSVDVRTVGPRRIGNDNFANGAFKRITEVPSAARITPEPAMSATINSAVRHGTDCTVIPS